MMWVLAKIIQVLFVEPMILNVHVHDLKFKQSWEPESLACMIPIDLKQYATIGWDKLNTKKL